MRILTYILGISLIIGLSSCQEDIVAIYGCTNSAADNYNPEATIDNGICTGVIACTDSTASNYDSDASINCGCKYENVRRVLVEEFTGHKCGNCPRAAETLHDIACSKGNQIIGLAVHVGFFAKPAAEPFQDDYRSIIGNALDSQFGNSVAGLPNGLVNRKEYNGSPISSNTDWETKVDEILLEPAYAKLTISNVYNADSRSLNTTVSTEILGALDAANYSLAIYLVEDSIISAQTDYAADPTTIEDYVHMHMLRTSLNGVWGENISSSTLTAGQSFETTGSITIDDEYKDQHLYIVSILSNNDTKEVVQVNKSSYIND